MVSGREQEAVLKALLKVDEIAREHQRRCDESAHELRAKLANEVNDALTDGDLPKHSFLIKALLGAATTRLVPDVTGAMVTAARVMGLSWEQIGQALGVSRQAAHQRYVDWEATYGGIFSALADAATDVTVGPRERRQQFARSLKANPPGELATTGEDGPRSAKKVDRPPAPGR